MAHGKLQLAMPMDEVKKISKLSLMVSFLSVDSMLDYFEIVVICLLYFKRSFCNFGLSFNEIHQYLKSRLLETSFSPFSILKYINVFI